MRAKTVTALLCTMLLASALLLSACGRGGGQSSGTADAVLINANPVCLQNFGAAREYSSAGRYELAREHYLLAYAAAGDNPTLRDALAKELDAVDLMIRSLR